MIDTYAHAAVRFGLGPRAGETPAADPRGWLLGQLDGADSADFSGLPSTSDAIRELMRQRAAKRADPQDAMMIHPGQDMLRAEAAAQMGHAIGTDAPFRERLVWFWANHFTVSLKRGEINALVGPYVREAIRPHVTGRFADMLLAVMRHPAMLIYLDNQDSAGPDSLAHAKRQAGLNENLGRESLELHTVTPAAGYTQADVTAYSRVLTGWSVDMKDDAPGFQFRPAMQDPGAKTVLGRSFPAGEAGGVAALTYLGTHPATYRALATALARHFIADMPPADAVERIAAVLGRSGGDLRLAAAAVVAEPGAWRPLAKLRAPQDYMVAVLRAAPAAVDPHDAVGMLAGLGQPLWTAPLPNGWGDRAADWCDPELLLRRADWAFQIAGKLGDADWERADPERVAADSLGGLLRPATLTAMQGAASRREALALLFTSPEFMRR